MLLWVWGQAMGHRTSGVGGETGERSKVWGPVLPQEGLCGGRWGGRGRLETVINCCRQKLGQVGLSFPTLTVVWVPAVCPGHSEWRQGRERGAGNLDPHT